MRVGLRLDAGQADGIQAGRLTDSGCLCETAAASSSPATARRGSHIVATVSTATPDRVPADPSSSYRVIENLIATYADLVDGGDFAGVGTLLVDATFTGGAGSVSGGHAIEKMLRDNLIIYEDGTPRTKHVTTNVVIEVDEDAGTAVSRSYYTVLQALPDLALQPIASGRYHDRFERRSGQWRFVERHVHTDLLGDVSRHLRDFEAPTA